MLNQSCIAAVDGHGPCGLAIESNILFQQLIHRLALMDHHSSYFLPIFNLRFPALCIGHGLEAFPFLLSLAGCFIVVEVNDIVTVISLYNGCHCLSLLS